MVCNNCCIAIRSLKLQVNSCNISFVLQCLPLDESEIRPYGAQYVIAEADVYQIRSGFRVGALGESSPRHRGSCTRFKDNFCGGLWPADAIETPPCSSVLHLIPARYSKCKDDSLGTAFYTPIWNAKWKNKIRLVD